MDSEISGLADLRGYLKSGGLVVRMSFPIIDLPSKHPRYIQRPENIRPEEPPMTSVAVGAGGRLEQKLAPYEINQNREHQLNGSGLSSSSATRPHENT